MEEVRLLIVCLGNQCRSPMCEVYLKSKMARSMARSIVTVYASVTSAGLLEGGKPIFSPAKWELERNGLTLHDEHYSRKITENDYNSFEYIICLDKDVLKSVIDLFGGDPEGKVHLLLDYTPDRKGEDIADPMFTDDYVKAYRDIAYGCDFLYSFLEEMIYNMPDINTYEIKGEKKEIVTEQQTVNSCGLAVYSTHSMIRLMEHAVLSSMKTCLDENLTTVGTRIDVKHLKASPVGAHIKAEAKLVGIDSHRLLFKVSAYDENGLIGEGEHERYMVDAEKFVSKLLDNYLWRNK